MAHYRSELALPPIPVDFLSPIRLVRTPHTRCRVQGIDPTRACPVAIVVMGNRPREFWVDRYGRLADGTPFVENGR